MMQLDIPAPPVGVVTGTGKAVKNHHIHLARRHYQLKVAHYNHTMALSANPILR